MFNMFQWICGCYLCYTPCRLGFVCDIGVYIFYHNLHDLYVGLELCSLIMIIGKWPRGGCQPVQARRVGDTTVDKTVATGRHSTT